MSVQAYPGNACPIHRDVPTRRSASRFKWTCSRPTHLSCRINHDATPYGFLLDGLFSVLFLLYEHPRRCIGPKETNRPKCVGNAVLTGSLMGFLMCSSAGSAQCTIWNKVSCHFIHRHGCTLHLTSMPIKYPGKPYRRSKNFFG